MANPTGRGGFQRGQSGNPGGRPKKDRPLTQMLVDAGTGQLDHGDDTPHMARVAALLWQAAASGKLRFPDETEQRLDAKEWIGLVRWLYTQIDGPPATRVRLGRDEEPEGEAQLTPDELRAEIHVAVRELARLGIIGPPQLGPGDAAQAGDE
jgi:hypothetical protein